MSRRLCCGSHSSIAVGHNSLDEFVFLIQGHIIDVMTKVAVSADVTSLATVIAGLCKGFEGLSVVNIYRDARRECM
jgi:hypothetical protein